MAGHLVYAITTFILSISQYTENVCIVSAYVSHFNPMPFVMYTVNVERFAGLNFHRFKPNEVFARKLLRFLTSKILNNTIIQSLYIFTKNFHGTLQKCENHENLTQ